MPGDRTSEPVYEMLWDCPACDTAKLLGKTHRYCPSCGSPQDPTKRYFPPEGEEVAVQDHVFFGVDKACPACETPNSAAASNCGSCGSPLDEAAQVEMIDEEEDPPTEPGVPRRPPSEPKSRKGLFGCLAIVLLVIVGVVVATQWTKTSAFTVQGHAWERTVEIEELETVSESAWCDSKPSDAWSVTTKSKERSTRSVPDGETCTPKNVDQGAGTFKKVEKCTPKTKSVPVYDDWCTYKVDRWKTARKVDARGKGLEPSPTWPTVKVDGCKRLGCTREGKRSEAYEVHFIDAEGETHDCSFAQERWAKMAVGGGFGGELTVIGSSIKCESLVAQ